MAAAGSLLALAGGVAGAATAAADAGGATAVAVSAARAPGGEASVNPSATSAPTTRLQSPPGRTPLLSAVSGLRRKGLHERRRNQDRYGLVGD